MKKLLTVSVLAIMAVSTANAEIASTGFVTDRTGTVTGAAFEGLTDADKNLTGAINAIAGRVGSANVDKQIDDAIKNAKVEDLSDGAQYAKTADVVTDAELAGLTGTKDAAAGKVVTGVTTSGGVVTAVSESKITNDFIEDNAISQAKIDGLTTALAGKANSATTLSGYGITDAYTKTEVDGKVANMEVTTNRTSNITQSLNDGNSTAYPTVGAVKTYLDDRFTLNEYSGEEGVNVNNLNHTITLTDNAVGGEKIKDDTVTSAKLAPAVRTDIAKGVAADTLSQQNKAAIESLPTTYAPINTVEEEEQNAINAASKAITDTIGTGFTSTNTVSSQLSAVKATADGAVQSVGAGTADGTISVDGTDVAVTGLGSAAYTASTDYATAAQGAKADTAMQLDLLKEDASWTEKGCDASGVVCSLVSRGGDLAWEKVAD